ncbi:MAG: ornithine carbamoyltransferase [Planctomycetes bacterium]|nr:ornithine carbamoyltransferase [Planctomycetota bacterium]
MKHVDSLVQLTPADVSEILQLSVELKTQFRNGERPCLLGGRVLTLVFEKPSLRTRVSFEVAIAQLGGSSLFLSCGEAGLNGRESVADVSRVLGSYSDWIVLRVFSHKLVDQFVEHAGCPIINGLSDQGHPCQALSDVLTVQETLGGLKGKTVVFVGDANNVARSLAVACAMTGVKFILAAPVGYQFTPDFVERIKQKVPTADVAQITDPRAAVARADVVYTDVWASMGQEAEFEKRKQVFASYQVNSALMAAAPQHARFMHCLPARRNIEVTDDVLDGPNSIVIPQAENRMHVARGILLWLQQNRSH